MDEQLSTWLDWIWSSRCLELLYTSRQSSNLKWTSGGDINSSRHQTSRWLKAAESSTVEWSDAMPFRASVYPVLQAVALHRTWPWHNSSNIIHRWCVGSSSAEGLLTKTLLLAHMWPSDEPLLHRRFIRCYCSSLNTSLSCSNWVTG
jgi:hypothetical protein